MRCKVYRSLDNPSSLLGMKGMYLVWFIVALGVSIFISVVLGALTSSIIGTMLFLILGLLSYFLVLWVQSMYSVKDMQRLFCSLRLHRYIMVQPVKFSELWNSGQDSEDGRR